MKVYRRTSISEFLGDFIVFRNLIPVDSRIPSLPELYTKLGLQKGFIPRKSDSPYGNVLVEMLSRARKLDEQKVDLKHLIYIGDTKSDDMKAFMNICHAGNFKGIAFIGAENDLNPRLVESLENGSIVCEANRWSLLSDFNELCRKHGFTSHEQTALVIDIDKTVLGARGRNDVVIDQIGIEAVDRIIDEIMSTRFNRKGYKLAFETLKGLEYRSFTTENRDYLIYTCLAIGSGVISLDSLTSQIKSGSIQNFHQFIAQVEKRVAALPADMRKIHDKVYECVCLGDPTPFKLLRLNEFERTVKHMGCEGENVPTEIILQKEIVLTEEVRDFVLHWKLQGSVAFGLTDRPDEALLPTGELVTHNFKPIHHTITHSIGE